MTEKDLLEKIKKDANSLTPPDSLSPDSIEKMVNSRRKKPAKPIYRFVRYGSIAAVFVLALAALLQLPRLTGQPQKLSTDTLMENSSSDEAVLQENKTETSKTESYTEAFPYAKDEKEIYKAVSDYYENYKYTYTTMDLAVSPSSMDAAAEESAMDTGNSLARSYDTGKGTGFSQTNIQEIGVDEGDIVKTDGTYIYILRKDLSFAIIKADKKSPETVSITSIDASSDAAIHEMYLDGTTLQIVISEYITFLDSEDDIYYTSSGRQTKLLTYDISDPASPVLAGTVTQDGSFETSRKNGSFVYLFTSYYPDIQDTYENSTIMPRINGTKAAAEDTYLPDSLNDSAYLVISSVDADDPAAVFDSKILVSGASMYYVSTGNIYIANERYTSNPVMTEITKFHYSDGEIVGVAAGSVKGYLNDSFSMNEYDGNLRVVTTYTGDEFNEIRDMASNFTGKYYEENWEEHNALYVLDKDMRQIGSLDGLADNETIRSARFFGDTGYFVTFRQTDPLFSVDLSDPSDPKILGELKVSGFSSYLHFYGENMLLGIGYEANEETGVVTGLKLSMFDISDPSNVTEVSRFVIPGITWCPAIESYKSILVDPEKNLIGFFCDNRYLLFSYDEEEGFQSKLVYDFYSDMLLDQVSYDTLRGLYIDNTFYIAGNTFVISFDMKKDFKKTNVLQIS